MMDVPATAWLGGIAVLPVLVLVVALIWLRWKGSKAATVAFLLALVIATAVFQMNGLGVAVALAKGFGLSMFVLLIIWPSVLLYNVVQAAGAMKPIGQFLNSITEDRILQCLLLSWCFSGFVQGISGFGMPVVIVAPLMVGVGFSPMAAATTSLVGHSWAVTYGSMASSFYSIQLVTGVPATELSLWMGGMFLIPILLCGVSVVHIIQGSAGVKVALLPVITVGLLMGAVMWLLAVVGMEQIASVLAGLVGCAAVVLIAKWRKSQVAVVSQQSPPSAMSLATAVVPYGFLVASILVFQIGPIKAALAQWRTGLDLPAVTTGFGHQVPAVEQYSAIQWFSHPFIFLFLSVVLGSWLFHRQGHLSSRELGQVLRQSGRQCSKTSISILLMVSMALLMNDSGMTQTLAAVAARWAGPVYPLLAPFVGVLGSFMTGSNTNSNVLFGALQLEMAHSIGAVPAILLAAQSIGGALGSAIAPAKAILGAVTVGLKGGEGEILHKTMLYCLGNAAVVGLLTLILTALTN